MTYRLDPNKSMDENFRGLINSQTMYDMAADEFTVSPFTVVTPNTGNGQANASAVLSAVPGGRMEGSATVYWLRVAPGTNVAGLTHTLKVSAADTHAKIQQAILQMYKIPPEELTWTLPAAPPRPGETLTYTFVPTALNKLLLATSRSVSVTNVDDIELESLEYFFGAATGVTYNGKRIFNIAGTTRNLYSNSRQDGKQCFLNLLNRKNLKAASYTITKEMVDVGLPEVSSLGGGNTLVLITPKPGCKFQESFYFSYTRYLFSNDTFNVAGGNLKVRYLNGIDVFYAWAEILDAIPLDEVRFDRITGSMGGNRSIYIKNADLPNAYVYAPGAERACLITY